MRQVWYPRKREPKKAKVYKRIEGFLYLIALTGTGLYKIGITTNLKKRLSNLKTGIPLGIEVIHTIASSDCGALERHSHLLFAYKNETREWFRLEFDDISYIKNSKEVTNS